MKQGKLDQKKRPDTGRLSRRREELAIMSKDALVDMLMMAEGHWSEDTIRLPKPTVTRSFSRDMPWKAEEYIKLPKSSADSQPSETQTVWRIVLVSLDLTQPVMGLELYGDVVIGRSAGPSEQDLDLTAYGANDYGASRKHALLSPTDEALYIVDPGSTNATALNNEQIPEGEPEMLEDRDLIAFGGVQFQIRIVE
jgi:hypothetical protein